ncbi:restriction endonuclease subunit S [Zavarzinia sp.]|uniref:restriction endonuclease subunit S n=1 Tax=Zavarzinia sp. TaxID=2027920 RepID=UPI003BB71F52
MSGNVPKGWRQVRIGQIAREISNRNRVSADIPVLSMTKHRGFVRSNEYFSKSVHSENTSQYKVVKRGQFAYATIHLDEGSIDYLKNEDAGLVSPMYTVFEANPAEIDNEIALQQFKRFALGGRFDPYSNGGVNRRKSILFSDLSAFKFGLPPLDEQRAIAEVLRSVEKAINKTEALIDQLRKAAVSIATDCISKFGDEVRSINIGSVLLEGPKSGLSPVCKDEPPGIGVLKLSAVSGGRLAWRDNVKFADVSDRAGTELQLKAGDFLIIRGSGSRDIVGSGCRVTDAELPPFPCIFPDLVIRLRADPQKVVPEYLAMMWDTSLMRSQIRRASKSTNGIYKINQTDIREFRMPLPNTDIQQELVTLIEGIYSHVSAERLMLEHLVSTRCALAQELLSGRLRLPESIIARYRDKAGQAA